MSVKRTPPMVEPDKHHGSKFTHPSYATLHFSRVSGYSELFDSSFTHHHYIIMRVHRAVKYTDGSHDFIHPGEELIEVAMSESQFARAITSMNMGSGSPCTLQRFNNKSVDQPLAEDRINSHRDMVTSKLDGVMKKQEQLGKMVAKWREDKHRPTMKELEELTGELERAASHFKANMTFYAQCFEEHMERVVDDAKTEIEAHVLASAGKLGVSAEHFPRLTGSDS